MVSNAKQILGDIVEQQRQERMPELSTQDYFEIFAAEQITKNYSLTYEDLEAGIVDGEHDGGVDSLFVFVNGELIREDTDLTVFKKNVNIDLLINQSKTAGGFSEDPLNRLISSLPKLLSLSEDYSVLSQYNSQIKSGFDIFRKAYRSLAAKFPSLSISISYAAMGAEGELHDNLKKKSEDLQCLVAGLFEEGSVKVNLLGARELLYLARQRPSQTFELRFSKSLSGENGYVVLSRLEDFNSFLLNGGTTIRSDLFESNVRDYQGSTEVNEEINGTLLNNDGVDFWWLNNGVTVLASNATLVGNVVNIENPQIVNGLQTSSEIARYFSDGGSDADRLLMIKVISSENEIIRDRIIKATNSQNQVPRASLRATDKVQRDIEHSLKMGGYFYDRRKNYYKNEGRPASKIISIPLLSQAMMTLLRGEPDNARARPSSLIKDDTVYNELFSESYPVDCYVVAAELTRRIELALKARGELSARDRNNLRFYCLYWISIWGKKKIELKPSDIASLRGEISDADIEAGIDAVSEMFTAAGGTDQIAKGTEFKKAISKEVASRIEVHFKSIK